jgi:peptide/nickel transport system substrate-binding protein
MTKHAFRLGMTVFLLYLVACSPVSAEPTATQAPLTPTQPAQATSSPQPVTTTPLADLTVGAVSTVPRNRTLMLGWALGSPIGVSNPWNLFYTNQESNNLLWEGLAYYAIFADKEIPWLAASMAYTKPDFTELTIKLNQLARWSDGQSVTARDVAFTFDGQMNKDHLNNHANFQQFVQNWTTPDDQTVVLKFKVPAPRFKFDVLTLKFDTGVIIVPAHVLSQHSDVATFAGGLDMPHSGPYRLVAWEANQKVFDLRPDWWAVQAGLIKTPAVQRVIIVNTINETTDAVGERVVNNEFDATGDVDSAVIASELQRNPKITSYTGNAPPYGYRDWWPNSLWVNTLLAPYSDARVRRALSLAIDRDKIDQVLYQGAHIATIYPFPLYPALQKFVDSPAVKALEAKYQPGKFDLPASAALMQQAGFAKNANGLWADSQGNTVNTTIYAVEAIHGALPQLLAEMLKSAGFDAVVNFGTDWYQNAADGKAGLYLFGHGASLMDPYATFELYHSRHSQPLGTPINDAAFSRYNNPAYDQIVDAMAPLPADDPQFQALAVQAMEIYWRDVIDIPIVQWLHRIPYNQTYWTNWPTQDNPAMGTNGAFWHSTAMLVIASLQPVQ